MNIWGIISAVASIVGFVAGIILLIKLFKKEGALKGILGLLCFIYLIIWGWMNHKALNMTKLMIVYSAALMLGWVSGYFTFLETFEAITKGTPPQVATQGLPSQPGPKEVPKAAPQPSRDSKAMPGQKDAAIDAQLDLKGFGQIGEQKFPLVPSTP
jgi:hypothetical protein